MLLIKTYLGLSAIEGIGLFAAQDIPADTVIWRLHPVVDVCFTDAELAGLEPSLRGQIDKYLYRDFHTRRLVLCGDDARFMNHVESPNTYSRFIGQDLETVTACKVGAGQELTTDYRTFCADAAEGQDPIIGPTKT